MAEALALRMDFRVTVIDDRAPMYASGARGSALRRGCIVGEIEEELGAVSN